MAKRFSKKDPKVGDQWTASAGIIVHRFIHKGLKTYVVEDEDGLFLGY